MKIAVLVFGRLNKCEETYSNIMSQLDPENNKLDFFMSSDNSPEPFFEKFKELYKPIYYTNEQIIDTYDLEKYPKHPRVVSNVYNMTRHFINKKRVFDLFEKYINENKMLNKDINYDIVLSLRIDTLFLSKLVFVEKCKENTIYIPEGSDHLGTNDQLAYGNIDVMRKYMNIIMCCNFYLDNKYTIPHPESLTRTNIIYNNIDLARFYLAYRFV